MKVCPTRGVPATASAQGRYGEKYSQALEATSFEYQTLRDYAWVAKSVELSLRKDNVPFSIHKEVAPLKPKQQARWLKKAADEQLTVAELRTALRLLADAPADGVDGQ